MERIAIAAHVEQRDHHDQGGTAPPEEDPRGAEGEAAGSRQGQEATHAADGGGEEEERATDGAAEGGEGGQGLVDRKGTYTHTHHHRPLSS